ncbi:MAG: DNA translocase FtsK, partial [Rhodocyclaceae bacterium]
QGDMLYLAPGTGLPVRVHGAYVADDEVHRVVEHLRKIGAPEFMADILSAPAGDNAEAGGEDGGDVETDPMYDQAVQVVLKTRRPSISLVQRHLRIGYNRAARMIEAMERAGLVSPMNGAGGREVLVPEQAE